MALPLTLCIIRSYFYIYVKKLYCIFLSVLYSYYVNTFIYKYKKIYIDSLQQTANIIRFLLIRLNCNHVFINIIIKYKITTINIS